MPSYYANIAGETFGPAEKDELHNWHRAGSLAPTDFIWDELSGCWVEAISIPDLAEIFRGAPDAAASILEFPESSTDILSVSPSTKGWKPTALIVGCIMAVAGTLTGVFLFQPSPAAQPAVPQNINLKRSAPLPEIVTITFTESPTTDTAAQAISADSPIAE